MSNAKNMHYTEPKNLRTPVYGEHYCLIFNRQGEYAGALYLDAKMRKVWRSNKFSVVIADV